MEDERTKSLRKRVAREAAILLYVAHEQEYKQAKLKAAKTLRARILPNNSEIAKELDQIAEEREGSSRRALLLRLREEALRIMESLHSFNPRLVGSVWRGTANKNSDIDITTFSHNPDLVLNHLQTNQYRVTRSEWHSLTKGGKKESSFHIYVHLPLEDRVEIVVRDSEEINLVRRCETYGDPITGLNASQLRKILTERPLQKFVPH